ncbi:MAG: protein-L-isoaspartate(D-aspartate) O-methyltransferase [Planctomycetota bacterium]|jgi:protein-L-isoaspartate(D-aspartate) O-methyltransferase
MRLSLGDRSACGLGAAALLVLALPAGCDGKDETPAPEQPRRVPAEGNLPAAGSPRPTGEAPEEQSALVGAEERVAEREAMVKRQIARRGVRDKNVLRACLDVPRHRFVPARLQREAYADYPLPIGRDQTISQPYIVALMTGAAGVQPGEKVLEVGTGSGYAAAVASRIAREVYTIEIIKELAQSAKKKLSALGVSNVHVRAGDGYRGWPKKAPFDAIIVTAAPDHVPQPLKDQLAVGGKLVIPVGPQSGIQQLLVFTRTPKGIRRKTLIPVRFVPMTGEAQRR